MVNPAAHARQVKGFSPLTTGFFGLMRRSTNVFRSSTSHSISSSSYNDLASSIESNDATDPSRQAVAMRLGKDFEEFLKSILGHVISLKVDQDILAGKFDAANFRGYRRVLPETHLPLDLPALLKRRGSLDIEVLMNATRRGPGFGSWRPPSTRKPPTSGA